MGVIETQKMKTVETQESDTGIKILKIILGIAIFIGGVVATALSGGTATTGYCIAVGITLGAIAGTVTLDLIEMVAKGNGPPIDLLLTNATSSVTWCTGASFEPSFGALNNGLQIGGNLVPTKSGLLGADATEQTPAEFHQSYQDQFRGVMAARRQS